MAKTRYILKDRIIDCIFDNKVINYVSGFKNVKNSLNHTRSGLWQIYWQNIDMNKQTRTYLETLLRSTGQLKDVYHAGLSYISMFTAYIRSEFL